MTKREAKLRRRAQRAIFGFVASPCECGANLVTRRVKGRCCGCGKLRAKEAA